MKPNIGTLDGTLRVLVGMVLIFGALEGSWAPWGWIGFVPLLTALFNFCPLYSIIGMNTCDRKS
ncbi:MAG: DUF2892 domain-containing protein [Mariprofundaceae bacterium]